MARLRGSVDSIKILVDGKPLKDSFAKVDNFKHMVPDDSQMVVLNEVELRVVMEALNTFIADNYCSCAGRDDKEIARRIRRFLQEARIKSLLTE